ncbi:MAG: DMT family transporter [Rhodovarius sp.]|nr:DMT family transporter [Rhodovarius sp.]
MSPSRRRAILFVLGAALLYACAAACVKALGGALPLAMVVLFRSLFALPVVLPLLLRSGLAGLATRRPGGHALRIGFGLIGMAATFHGLATLPIATVTALGFTMPLFLVLLSRPVLGEPVSPARAAAALAGFIGVLLILRPGLGAAGQGLDYAIVLGGALAWALAMMTIRRLGEAGEPATTIVLWFAIGGSVVAAVFALPVWIWPDPRQWALLVGAGLLSGAAQLLMTEAYRSAETALIAPFEYSGILWTGALGLLIWAEAPDPLDAAGIAILIGCGVALWRLEARPAR